MTRPRSTFSLLVATTLGLLLCAGNTEAKFKGINPWCRTSDYRALCTRMVGNAKTQDEAITNAVQSSLAILTRISPQFKASGKMLLNLPEEVASTCQESYDTAVYNLQDALNYQNIGNDHYTVLDRIQAAESSFFDCTDAIKQMGGDAELVGKTTDILYKFASNNLAVATQM